MSENINFSVTSNFDSAREAMGRFAKTMRSSSSSFNTATKNLNKMRGATRNLNTDANRSAGGIGNLSKSIGTMNKAMNVYAMYRFAGAVAGVIQSSMDAVEVTNMFSVSMGELAEETDKSLQSLSKLTGLDLTSLREDVGTFNILAKSMGMTSGLAQRLAINTTQLGLDLSSLFNVPIKQVMADLKSGLIGQTETVYKYGMDLTEASLQQEALRLGIEGTVRTMTQGEKMFLRSSLMMRQASIVNGDFARTLEQPANQIRMLGQDFVTLSRTIGNVFLPVIGSIVPYVRAVVMVITELFRSLGAIFGITFDKVENISSSVGTGGGGIADGLDDASGSAKKLKKEIKDLSAPFDELNAVNLDVGSTGTGGAGGVGGVMADGLTDDMLGIFDEYDLKLGQIKQKAMDIRDRIMEWLGFELRVDKATGELVWKLKEGYTNLEKIRDIASTLGVLFLAWKINKAFGDDILKIIKNLGRLKSDLIGFIALSKEFGFLKTVGGLFGKGTIALAGWLSVIAVIALRFNYLMQTSEKFRIGVDAIVTGFKSLLKWMGDGINTLGITIKAVGSQFLKNLMTPEGYANMVALFNKIGTFLDALDLDLADLGLTIAGVALLFTPFAPMGVVLLGFEAISVAVRTLGYAMSDCVDKVDVFAGISSETTTKLQPLIDRLRYLDDTITELEFTGKIIDDSVVEDVAKKTAQIRETIVNELDADRNSTLQTLSPLKGIMSDKSFNDIIEKSQQYYNTITEQVINGEARINEIMATARAEGRNLEESDIAEISQIRQTMLDTGVRQFTESEVEYTAIMNRLKDSTTRISLEQASEIIKNAKATKDETVASAEKQYAEIQLHAQNMYDVGAISKDEYNNIINSAKQAKESTIKDAEEQYKSIETTTRTKLGDVAKYIDIETGDIKTKWRAFCDENSTKWSEWWGGLRDKASVKWDEFLQFWKVAVPDWWGTHVSPWFTKQKWLDLFSPIKTSIKTKWDEMVLQWKTDIKSWWDGHVAKWFNKETWKQLGKDAIDGLIGGLGNLWQKGVDFAKDFITGFRSKDGIDSHSPARAMIKAGQDMVDGLEIPFGEITTVGAKVASGFVGGFATATTGMVNIAKDIVGDIEKVFNGISYKPDVDYSLLIAEAERLGDIEKARELEKIRNAKISGEGMSYEQTDKYSDAILSENISTNEKLDVLVGNQLSETANTTTLNTEFMKFAESMSTKIDGNYKGIQSMVADLKNLFINNHNDSKATVNNNSSRVLSKLNDVISAVNNIRINITYNYYSMGTSNKQARGGINENGAIFQAGEAGAELIGSYGGKTTVMPLENSSFVEAMGSAVYDAVRSAQDTDNGQIVENILMLDNEVIYKGQQKLTRQKGKNFGMGAFAR